MLSDEERKAIEFFEKSFKKKIPPYWYDDTISNIEEKIKTILNLIEKQSKEIEHWKAGMKIIEKDKNNHIKRLEKEIEELKDKNKKLQDKAKELIFEKQELTSALLDSTPNDKIKAKIEELDYNDIGNFERRCKQEVLQSLLEKED